MAKRNKLDQGFTLFEVVIAISIFAVFMTAYMASQGYNISDSMYYRQEVELQALCENKINELLVFPPSLTANMDGKKEVKNFEEAIYRDYNYTIEYKKFVVPDLSQMLGASQDQQKASQNQNQEIQKMVFTQIKENFERMIWQVRITVLNKSTNQSFVLATWIRDPNAQLQVNGL